MVSRESVPTRAPCVIKKGKDEEGEDPSAKELK